ncbi:MAG: ATP-grasp domain-containing protein [Planctomycetota bacterium]
MAKKIGLLYGLERTFPGALAEEVRRQTGGKVACEPVLTGALRVDRRLLYDVILDRISHEVPFYRTLLKQAAMQGTQVVNNPFWFSADDKYFGCLVAIQQGVGVPRTILLPHKDQPPNTKSDSFSNLRFPLEWEELFSYLGFPIYLKPAYGGGWKHVYKVHDPVEFFEAYHKTGDLCMMAQESIEFSEYYRCYVIGRERVHLMRYDPRAAFHERYVRNAPPVDRALSERMERDCVALCGALGYDFNTVELAVREGVPYAIDFTNPCPDCDPPSVGDENFEWVLKAAAELLIRRAKEPRQVELTGHWAENAR